MLCPLNNASVHAIKRHFMARLMSWFAGIGCLLAMSDFASAADVTAAADPSERIAAHLQAGEFGAALEIAARVSEPRRQSVLLQTIAAAQQKAGEQVTASIRRIQQGSRRAGRIGESSLAGGMGMPDFRGLMRIIQDNTSGPWGEESGAGDGGKMTPYPLGVRVAPNGLLSRPANEQPNAGLAQVGLKARKADLNADVARRSDLRLVSLTRLEQAVAARLSDGLPVPETMAQLAGLSQIKYVIVSLDSHEVVIGGPADAWEYNAQGQPVISSTGHPTLQLDDLVTLLRTFSRSGADFGCSINTRDAGIRALADFVQKSQAKGPISSTSVRNWTNQMQQKLGRQDISIWGVAADSRVARVIVEADYRMKLIGIEKLNAGKEIPSYFDLLQASQPNDAQTMNALRWWLTTKYDALTHSADRSVFEIHGSAVLCQSENQVLTAEGKHLPTGESEQTNRLFAEAFTAGYDKLAARDSVFAHLKNIFDLALVAALIQHENLATRSGWEPGAFAPQGDYQTVRYTVPREVESVVNHRVYNNRDIVVQVAGGVRADVMAVVRDPSLNQESPRLSTIVQTTTPTELPTSRWWWDAAR